jgi:hypothetical protein
LKAQRAQRAPRPYRAHEIAGATISYIIIGELLMIISRSIMAYPNDCNRDFVSSF